MLLDRLQSLCVAMFGGIAATLLSGVAGTMYLAKCYPSDSSMSLYHRAVDRPFAQWDAPFKYTILGVPGAGLVIAALVFWLLWNKRWGHQPRTLVSHEARSTLLRHGVGKREPHIFAGRFGGKPLRVGLEDRGLVFGPPGTGKTVFLMNQVLQASEMGLSFALVDFKPELHQILAPALKAAGYRVLLVNPSRQVRNADHWNPLADIDDSTDIAELCASLLPIQDASRNAPFVGGQLDWLKAAVYHIKTQPGGSLPAAFALLSSEPQAARLAEVLSASPSVAAASIGRRMAAGLSEKKPNPLIVQGLTDCLRALSYLELPSVQTAFGHSDFAITDIGQDPRPTALFLQFEETKISALGPLLAFTITALLTALINTTGKRRPVALFLDELGNMPPISDLPQKLNTLRSRQIPVWMYFQTSEQIEQRYGRGYREIFFAAADLQMVFRLNDVGTRKLISELVGTTERDHTSQTMSTGGKGDSTSRTTSRKTLNVIEPHELGELQKHEVVCLYRGASAKGMATPHYDDFPAYRRPKQSSQPLK